jgi:hypothetical protein
VRLWSKPELLGYKSADFDQFRPIYGYLKFKQLEIFSIFEEIGQLFFQNAILGKIGPRTIKNGFSEIV